MEESIHQQVESLQRSAMREELNGNHAFALLLRNQAYSLMYGPYTPSLPVSHTGLTPDLAEDQQANGKGEIAGKKAPQ